MASVIRRFLCPILVALLALQAVTASAFARISVDSDAAIATHCADGAGDQNDATECPCCPDGATSMLACSAACTAVAALSTIPRFVECVDRPTVMTGVAQPLASQSYIPFKPPPIR